MRRSVVLSAALVASLSACGQTAPPTSSPRDQQTRLEMLCGNQGLPPTSTEIPTIGCFGVSSGGSARGVFDGHQFTVAVDVAGEPRCRLDNATVECSGCIGEQVPRCPVMLMIVSHNADKSVSLNVQRKADGEVYLYRIDSWNRYLEQRRTRQEAEAAQAQTAAPALPSGTPGMRQQSGGPTLPPEIIPGSVEATDGAAALTAVAWKAQGAYGSGQFVKLDQLIETLSQPDQLTDDGMPRLLGVSRGLWEFLYAWKNWQSDLDKIAEWRKQYPDSYGADLTEAILWRAWGWQVRGEGYASTVTPEGWKLFSEKLAHADELLERCKSRASRSPLWYELRLAVARDIGWDRKRHQALFIEATQRFPWYVPLYLSAADYLSPKWGGTYADVDKLARRTTATPLGSDHSLYTRIYWELTQEEREEFEPFRDSNAAWSLMKAGFEGLMKRYPKSRWNLNGYAYFACRAHDGPTYGMLRARIGHEVVPAAWASNYSSEVCDERLLRRARTSSWAVPYRVAGLVDSCRDLSQAACGKATDSGKRL